MALLGNLTGSSQFFSDELFYNGVATQSLRLDNSASSLLTRTPSAGNRKTWTWSAWIKRGDIGRDQDFFTAEGSGGQLYAIMVTDGDQLQIYAASAVLLLSNQLLRDTSAWYHIVVKSDTTQGTASDRLKIYLNGSEVTSFATDNRGSYAQNTDYGINSNVKHNIGSNQAGGNFGDYYIAEVNFVDGTAYDASYFGETKNGVWIPKKYTGSYGTQGFRLEFKQTGDGSSTASSSTIGADTSGNGNHYKDTNLDAHDSNMPDSPENNFCTMNDINASSNVTMSNGNLTTVTSSAIEAVVATLGVSSGKWYWEVHINANATESFLGITTPRHNNDGASFYDSNQLLFRDDNGSVYYSTLTSRSLPAFEINDIVKIKLDLDNQTMEYSINDGSYVGSITLTDFNSHVAGETWLPTTKVGASGGSGSFNHTYNFGQDSSFAGTKTAQGNTDANGIGDFYYAPPSGFLALCTSNLPEPTISPNADTQADDYFNTLIYDGNDDATRTFDVGFVSDWSWFKARNGSGYGHQLYDSSRGVTKRLFSNTTAAESTNAEGVIDFDDSGTLLKIGTDAFLNEDGTTMVIWNWKANGGTTTTNDASATSIGSQDSVYQANTTAGFSIVTYTGTGANDTFAHGLGVAPRYIIFKKRASGTQNWVVYHEDVGNNRQLFLNLTNAQTGTNSVYFNNTSPTTTVFTLGSDDYANADGGTYVAYCFADVEGYSKFGSYTGNGSTDGTFVYTGFRPAWVMFKKTSATDDWVIIDSTRDVDNVASQTLYANGNFAEDSNVTNRSVDFLSNGFKLRSSGTYINLSSGTFIYMAFAEAPFKYANAR